jgi:cell volume regulation protein A
MQADAQHVAIAGALLALGVSASMVANRLRLPALVLFLGLGMLIGTDGLGWIDFEDYELARLIGSVALALILYDAGLATGFRAIRPVLRPAVALAFIATVVTALVTGVAATVLFELPSEEGFLLGAILAATDGAAVFALLRATPLPSRVARTLEAESGLNDPVAVLLVLVGVNVITNEDYTAIDALLFFVSELAVGAVLVFPSQLGSVMTRATVLALVIAFVARPLGAALATLVARHFALAERVVIAWAGMRGAIPVVLATLPVIENVPRSLEFFNIVFFAVLISTVIQGTTIGPLARRLRVSAR